jgi:hypothetical protein
MAWLTNFLANKIVAPLALAGCLILAVVAGVQTVRINGVSIFGWYAVDGYKPMYEAAARDNSTLKTNQAALKAAIKDRNAQITALNKQSEALRANIKVLSARYQDDTKTLQSRLAALAAAKPSGATECERAKSARKQIEDDRRWQSGQVPANHEVTP